MLNNLGNKIIFKNKIKILILEFLNFFEKLGDKSVLDFNEIEMINTYFPDFDSAFDAFFTELSLKNSINIDDDEPNDL